MSNKEMPDEIWVDKVLSTFNVWKGYERPRDAVKYVRADTILQFDLDKLDLSKEVGWEELQSLSDELASPEFIGWNACLDYLEQNGMRVVKC